MKKYWLIILSFLISGMGLTYFGYFVERSNLPFWILAFLFCLYFFQIKNIESISSRLLWSASIGFRVLLLFALPVLTDDYFRFFWDGTLTNSGVSPFELLPSEIDLANFEGLSLEMYQGLNSPDYYSVYPPFCQWIFRLGAAIFPTNIYGAIVIMKIPVVLADIGSIILLQKLLKHWKFSPSKVWLYALNPLVLIEFSGNLHLEVFFIFFLLAGVWAWETGEFAKAGLFMSFGVAAKLLPLLILPFFLFKESISARLKFFSVLGFSLLLFFREFLIQPELALHFFQSIRLYFQTFEFNASFYFIFREIGFWITGYNTIAVIGQLSSVCIFALVMFLAIKNRNKSIQALMLSFLAVFSVYLIFASIVHPWYILPLIPLCLFTNFRFPIAWSALIGLSYFGYGQDPFYLHWGILIIEYGILAMLFFYEWKFKALNSN
ncbi:MAG: alpha-1,6-mannosyltransferase [Flavobacteriales bacterium]|jgi:alpha-1,6-mannosyltransferase